MQCYSPAARRFYRAFYQWSLLASPSASSRVCTGVRCRALATSHALRQDAADGDESLMRIRKHVQGEYRHGDTDGSGGVVPIRKLYRGERSRASVADNAVNSQGPYKTWRALPAQTSAERPFSSFRPWEGVIRFKSDTFFMLEVAVPQDKMENMKAHFGPGLERLAEEAGARIELGSVAVQQSGGKASHYSMLVSGAFENANKVVAVFGHFSNNKPSDMRDAQRARQQARVENPKPGRDPHLSPAKSSAQTHPVGTYLGPRRWRKAPVQSAAERPFGSLAAWDEVIRSRADGSTTLEMAIPGDRATALTDHYGPNLQLYNRQTGVRLKLGHLPSASPPSLCSLLITGSLDQVALFIDGLISFRKDNLFEEWKAARAKQRDSAPDVTAARPAKESRDAAPQQVASAKEEPVRPTDKTADAAPLITRNLDIPIAFRSHIMGPNDKTRQLVKQLSGVQSFKIHVYRDRATIVAQLVGRPEACATATRMIEDIVKLVYQHPRVDSEHLPPRPDFVPKPNFVSRLKFKPSVDRIKRAEIVSAVDGKDDVPLRQIEMETLCLVRKHRRDGLGGWLVIGPQDRIETAIQKLEMRIREKCEAEGWDVDATQAAETRPVEAVPTNIVQAIGDGLVDHGVVEADIDGTSGASHSQRSEFTSNHVDSAAPVPKVAQSNKAKLVADDLRAVLRPLTHPVVLITSRLHDPEGKTGSEDNTGIKSYRGVTVSSFSAVTLHPEPIVSFNLKIPSRTWDAMLSNNRLVVHILSATPAAAALTHAFTQPYDRPHEPFETVQKLGGHVTVNSNQNLAKISRPPRIYHSEGVLARIFGILLPEKCVVVGDHVVVIARVRSVAIAGQSDDEPREVSIARLGGDGVAGLSYARKAYRSAGQVIEPLEVPQAGQGEGVIQAALGERGAAGDTHLAEEDDADLSAPEELHQGAAPHVTSVPSAEGVAQAAAEGGGAADDTHLAEEDDADLFAPEGMHQGAPEHVTSVQSAEDARDDYFLTQQEADDEEADLSALEEVQQGAAPHVTSVPSGEEAVGDYFRAQEWMDDEEVEPASATMKAKGTAAVQEEDDYDLGLGTPAEPLETLVLRVGPRPDAMPEKGDDVLNAAASELQSVVSTHGKAAARHNRPALHQAQARHPKQHRSYSTSTSADFKTDAPSNERQIDARDQVTDPSMLSQTVADFLGQPQQWTRPRPMRALRSAQEASSRASSKLEQALASGTLTEEDSQRLERTIQVNDRRVAKALALGAAADLRRMLDEGKVDVRTAQWMEQAVEKGMVVVVEEAKRARGWYDAGTIDEEQLRLVREQLEADHGLLNVEAMRLRQWFEDEEGGFDGGLS